MALLTLYASDATLKRSPVTLTSFGYAAFCLFPQRVHRPLSHGPHTPRRVSIWLKASILAPGLPSSRLHDHSSDRQMRGLSAPYFPASHSPTVGLPLPRLTLRSLRPRNPRTSTPHGLSHSSCSRLRASRASEASSPSTSRHPDSVAFPSWGGRGLQRVICSSQQLPLSSSVI